MVLAWNMFCCAQQRTFKSKGIHPMGLGFQGKVLTCDTSTETLCSGACLSSTTHQQPESKGVQNPRGLQGERATSPQLLPAREHASEWVYIEFTGSPRQVEKGQVLASDGKKPQQAEHMRLEGSSKKSSGLHNGRLCERFPGLCFTWTDRGWMCERLYAGARQPNSNRAVMVTAVTGSGWTRQ